MTDQRLEALTITYRMDVQIFKFKETGSSTPTDGESDRMQCSYRVLLKSTCAFLCFFLTSCFFVLFFGLEVLFFPDFGEIMIKIVIFVYFKYFKRNISELSLR